MCIIYIKNERKREYDDNCPNYLFNPELPLCCPKKTLSFQPCLTLFLQYLHVFFLYTILTVNIY